MNGALTINRKALAVTATGINKAYDGLTTASVTYADDRIASDVLTTSGTAIFTNPNVGVGRTITVTGIAATGTDANNYTPNTTTATTADITGALPPPPPPPSPLSTEIPDSFIRIGEYNAYAVLSFEDAIYATPNLGYLLVYLPSNAPNNNLRLNRPTTIHVTPLNYRDDEEERRRKRRASI